TMKPFWASDNPKSGTMEFASAPSSTHIMKLTSKYKKAHSKVGKCPALRKSRSCIASYPLGRRLGNDLFELRTSGRPAHHVDVLFATHANGARLVRRLFRIRIEDGVGQLVGRVVV